MFEKQALKQYDHSLDQESWPLLELTDACVYRYRRSEKDIMADLLDVQDTGPYRIRGRLSPVPAEYADIVYPGKAARLYSEELTIAGVTTYSIQSLADGTFTLWALGQCGWYSLQPSRRYAPIFAGAVEKMQLWAFLQDRYLDTYEGAGPPIPGTVAEVYADYSRLRRESCPSAKTAKRLFDQHHRFLLFEMCAAWTDTPMWARTPLFRDWKVAYKREVEGVVKMAAAGSLEDRIKAGVVKQEVKEEEEEEGEGGGEVEVPPPPPPPPQPKKQGGSGKALAKKVPAKKGPAKKLVQQKLHPIFVKKEPAAEPDHIIILDTEDEAAADSEDEGDDEDEDDEEEEEEEDDDDDSEDDEDVQPSSSSARRGRGRPKATPRPTHSSKGKSILRPVRTSAPAPDYSHGFTDSDSDPAPRSPTKRTITTTTTTKRSADPARSSSSTTTTASKRACTASARTAASTPTSTTTSTTSTSTTSRPSLVTTLRIGAPTSTTTTSAAAAAAAAAAARIKTTTTTTTTTFISSAASPLASIAPKAVGSNRPGGLWECEIAGCRHFVLHADRAESLAAVEAHYEEHGRVMRLAMEAIGGEVVEVERERGRGGVLAGAGGKRVDNLLAKIEAMAERWAMTKPAALGGEGDGAF